MTRRHATAEERERAKIRKSKAQAYRRLNRYGLTPDEHIQLLKIQHNGCAICGRPGVSKALAVDHDHSTMENRGLLCGRCNNRLGWFEAKRDIILAYLENPPYRQVVVAPSPGTE